MYKYLVAVSPEESITLQKFLFHLGYCWVDGGQTIRNLKKPYLHIDVINSLLSFSTSSLYINEGIIKKKFKLLLLKEVYDLYKEDCITINYKEYIITDVGKLIKSPYLYEVVL